MARFHLSFLHPIVWSQNVFRALLFFCLLLTYSAAQAQSVTPITIVMSGVPGNPDVPFSGTRCGGSGSAQANLPGAYITQANLYINSTLVKSYQYPDGNPASNVQSLNVMFASTHFSNGSDIKIKFEAYDNYGSYNEGEYTRKAYNVACIYGRNDLEAQSSGTGPAKSNLGTMNHDVSRTKTTKGWWASQMLGDITPCTAFYVNTHGNSQRFDSDVDEDSSGDDPDQYYIYPSKVIAHEVLPDNNLDQVLERRQTASTANNPPINVVFVDACWTGSGNEFADSFLWPYMDYGTAIDQAELGWNIIAPIPFTNTDSSTFWGALANTYTAQEARNQIELAYLTYMNLHGYPPGKHVGDYVHCWGDYNTTLQGVYTNSPMQSGQTRPWYY